MANHPNVRLLRVTNNEVSSYSSGSGASIKFQSNDSDLHGINRIHLKTSIIPNTQYNINSKNNQLNISWVDMPGPFDSLPVGQYNITTFCAALQANFDAFQAGAFEVSVNPLTYKITITRINGIDFTIADKSVNPMYLVLGQDKEKTSIDGVLECDSIYNLSGLRHVYIESFTLGKSLLTGSVKKYSTVADIPISVPFGSFQNDIHTEEGLNNVYYKGWKNVSNFEMQLVDEYGDLIQFNGAPWILIFEIHGN